MAKYKLAISIPTYERPDCISELVDYMIDEAEKLNIGIYVFDGSEHNDDTQNACKKYERYNCFNYIRHKGTVAVRHCEAIYKPDCEYLWITRDRTILKTEYWPMLLNLFQEQYDLYMIGDNPIEDHVKIYTNPKKLLTDFCFNLTFFGSSIVKKSFLKNISYTNEDFLTNFPMVYKIFSSACETPNFKALYLPFRLSKSYLHIHEELRAEHLIGKNFLETWAKNWSNFIDNLPEYYNDVKQEMKLYTCRDLRLWSFFGYLNLCRRSNIKLKDIFEYKKYIKQVTNIPWFIIVILAAMPSIIPHIIREIIRPFLRVYYHRKHRLDIKNTD